jgi:hypothetical protein
MSVEDRVIKLESFAADVREHTRILTDILLRHDERIEHDAARTADLERHFKILTDLAVRASERADDADAGLAEMREAQANADARIAALADAQIRTEDALRKLIERDERRGQAGGQ